MSDGREIIGGLEEKGSEIRRGMGIHKREYKQKTLRW